jgi:hypothetical protein
VSLGFKIFRFFLSGLEIFDFIIFDCEIFDSESEDEVVRRDVLDRPRGLPFFMESNSEGGFEKRQEPLATVVSAVPMVETAAKMRTAF